MRRDAAVHADSGVTGADLIKPGLIKQSVAQPGQRRQSGYRPLIACRAGGLTVVVRSSQIMSGTRSGLKT